MKITQEEKLAWQLYVDTNMKHLMKEKNFTLEGARQEFLETVKNYEDYAMQKPTMLSMEALDYVQNLIIQYPLKNL